MDITYDMPKLASVPLNTMKKGIILDYDLFENKILRMNKTVKIHAIKQIIIYSLAIHEIKFFLCESGA